MTVKILDKRIFFYVYTCLGGGVLGSVATIVSGSTYYTTVYNFDSTVDGVDTFTEGTESKKPATH